MVNGLKNKDFFKAWNGHCDPEKAVGVLNSYSQNKMDLSDVNRIMELYQVKLFFDVIKDVSLWDCEKYNFYKKLSQKSMNDVQLFYNKITEMNIIEIYSNCYHLYHDDFWKLIFLFRTYEKIQREHFVEIMKQMNVSLHQLLKSKNFVSYFDLELTDFFKISKYSAELLVDYYLEKHIEPLDIILPKSLTSEIKYQIISDYIDSEDANANVLKYIMYGRNTKEFPLDDKIRYRAQKRFNKIYESVRFKGSCYKEKIQIWFDSNLPDRSLQMKGQDIIAEYNIDWIRNNLDYQTLLSNFVYLFGYTDYQMRCSLVSLHSQMGIIESTLTAEGNTMYKYGYSFALLNELANIQMLAYISILEKENIYIEDMIKWFFEDYLKSEFEVEGFKVAVPVHTDSILCKHERIASVMDGIIKQFKMFREEGMIDRGLFEMSSGSTRFKDIPSFIKNKYAYCNSKDLMREMYDVFSNQSMLYYTERTKANYTTFFDLIVNEKIEMKDIEEYQIEEIEWLIKRATIKLVNNVIHFNDERVKVLSELYHKEVICLQYHKSDEIKKLINEGEIVTGSTLLSHVESQYFDYNLNKSDFTNGPELRNKYIHDTGPLDVNEQQRDYIILLKLMIILIIKINEEFCLRYNFSNGEIDFYD